MSYRDLEPTSPHSAYVKVRTDVTTGTYCLSHFRSKPDFEDGPWLHIWA